MRTIVLLLAAHCSRRRGPAPRAARAPSRR
jgi:hypothetical protein